MIKNDLVNDHGLFQSVHISDGVAGILPEQRARYLACVQDVLKDYASLKDNPEYCNFVSQKVGFDLATGFQNLQKASLNLKIHPGMDFNDTYNFKHDPDDGYSFDLDCSHHSIRNRSDATLHATIAHEVGHMLKHAAEDMSGNAPVQNVYTKDYKKNWNTELDVDKIAVASNSDNVPGKALADQNDTKHEWVNIAYQNDKLSSSAAKRFALFCHARDSFINSYVPKALTPTLNHTFRMNCSLVHPSAIVRSVEAENFARQSSDFLKNQR